MYNAKEQKRKAEEQRGKEEKQQFMMAQMCLMRQMQEKMAGPLGEDGVAQVSSMMDAAQRGEMTPEQHEATMQMLKQKSEAAKAQQQGN